MTKEDREPTRVTFKLKPAETGLRRVGAGPRSSHINLNGSPIGSVCALGGGWRGPVRGWYWVIHADAVRPGSPLMNTCHKPAKSADEAKAQAKKWIQEARR